MTRNGIYILIFVVIMVLAFVVLFFTSSTIGIRLLQFIIGVTLLCVYSYCYKLEYTPIGHQVLNTDDIYLVFNSNFYSRERRYYKIDSSWYYVDEEDNKVHHVTECIVVEYLHKCSDNYRYLDKGESPF